MQRHIPFTLTRDSSLMSETRVETSVSSQEGTLLLLPEDLQKNVRAHTKRQGLTNDERTLDLQTLSLD